MFIIVIGQHVSILIESSSGPSKNTDPYLAMPLDISLTSISLQRTWLNVKKELGIWVWKSSIGYPSM